MDNDKRKKVYDVLTSQTGYKDSFEDFNKFMNDRSAREKVYGVLRDKTGYKDSFDDFDNFMSGISQGVETTPVVSQQRPSLREQVDNSQFPVMEDLPWMKNTGGQNGMLSADNLGDRLEEAYKRGDFEPFRHREEDTRIRNEYTPKQVVNEADIMENAKNRFALTERWKELVNELASIRKEKTDRYLEEFKNSDEYKAIAGRKPETQEEADAMNNTIDELFSQKYGARLEEEMQPYNDAYHNEVLSRYGTDIKAGLTKLGKKSTSEQVAGLTEEVNALLEKEHEVLKQHGGSGNNAMNALMGSAQYNQATGERRKEIGALESARKLLENSQEIINEARKAGNTNFAAGLIRGVRDNFDADKWTFGLAEMADAKYLNNALEKSARGEILTPAEEKLLDASTINMATQAYFSSDLGRGYKAGSVTAESLPFMLEFLVNPISSSGNTIAKGVLKYGLKRFGSVASTKGARIAGRMIGDSAAALGMEGTTGIGRVAAGTLDRMNQNYETSFNDEGEVEVKKTGDMGIGEALARSGASTFLENQSEMIFNAFRGGGKAARKAISDAAPGMSEKTANRIIDFYNKVRNNKTLKSVSDKAQFHGLLEEYGEEVYNNMANVAIGEMSAEDAFDVDNNIDTFLGLAPTSLAFATLGIGGLVTENIQAKNRLRKFVENLNEEGREIFSELWDEIEKGHDNIAKAFVKKTLTDESLSAEEKRDRIFSVRDMINARNTEQEIGEADNETVVATEEVPIPTIDKVNVYRNFKRAERRVAQLLSGVPEETLNSITDVDKFAVDNNLNDAQKTAVADYVSAREPYNNYQSEANTRREAFKTNAREQASADIDKIINKDNGFVIQAKHKFLDNPVYIERGNLVFGEDGLLDKEKTSKIVYYRDENGDIIPASPNRFDSILSQNTKDELVAEAEAQADADFVAQEEESLASPDIPVPERGVTVAIKGENYLIEGPDEDNPGNVLAYKLDANGEIDKQEDSSQVLSLTPDEYYSAKEAELWNNDEQTANVASPESEEMATDIPVSEIRETGTGEVADTAQGINTSDNQPRNESSPEAEESKVSEVGQAQDSQEETPEQRMQRIIDSLPKKKDGKIDYKVLTPRQQYDYTSVTESEEVAASDLREEISAREKELKKMNERLTKVTGGERAEVRDAIRERRTALDELQSFYNTIAPASVEQQAEAQDNSIPNDLRTDEDYISWVADNSDDVKEIADAYAASKELASHEQTLKPWQRELLGRRINSDSFYRFGDRNHITGGLAKAWLRKDGEGIDTLAQELSTFGGEVTEQDIIDFILANPSNRVSQISDDMRNLSRRFSEIASKELGFPVGGPESNTGKLYLQLKEAKAQVDNLTDAQKGQFVQAVAIDMDDADRRRTNGYYESLGDYAQQYDQFRNELDAEAADKALIQMMEDNLPQLYHGGFTADELDDIYSQIENNNGTERQAEDSRENQSPLFGEEVGGYEESGTPEVVATENSEGEEQNSGVALNLEDNSVSLQEDNQKVNENDEISESIPQGEHGTETSQDGGLEEALAECRRRSSQDERYAQANSGTLSERERKEIENRAAENYAKEKGVWIPMQKVFSLGAPAPSGNENDVYLDTKDNSVYKVNNLMNSGNVTSLLERLNLHNEYFPDTKYELVGFSGFENGDVFPVLKQRYIEGADFATPEDIDGYMRSLGFKQRDEATYSNGDVTISDLRPRNVLKDADGDIYVIDADFKKESGFAAPSINPGENVLDYAERISREKGMHDVRRSVNTNPTEAQKEAGNYKKGHLKLDGYNITIENPKGSVRSGTDANGQAWSVTMNNDYGYIRGTKAVDGDHIDIFLSDTPMEGNVFVVDQNKEDGTFDESKVMYGFASAEEARTAYLSNYSSGWENRIGAITEVSKDEFKKWVSSSVRKTKPFADYRSVKSEDVQSENQDGSDDKSSEAWQPHTLPGRLMKAYESGDETLFSSVEQEMSDFVDGADDMMKVYVTYLRSKDLERTMEKGSPSNKTQRFIAEACKKTLKRFGLPAKAMQSERARTEFAGSATDSRVLDIMSADMSFDVIRAIIRNPHASDATLERFTKVFSNNGLDYEARQELDKRKAGNNDDGIRFRAEDVEDEDRKELIAVHNISEEKLKEALDLGGFPMPSIAITKADVGHTTFGDISLVFDKESITPTDKRNKVYGEDAWTPTFPSVGYKLNDGKTADIYRRANKAGRLPLFNPVSFHRDNYERHIDRLGSESLVNHFKDDYDAKQLYLSETGNAVEEYEQREVEKYPPGQVALYEKMLQEIGVERIKNERNGALEDDVKRLIEDHYDINLDTMKPFIAKARVSNTIHHAIDYAENGNKKTEDDIEATKKKIDERIDPNKFAEWLEDLFAGVVEKRGIRNDRDMFTPSGSSHKWEQLYDKMTLNNVVREMRKQAEKGGQGLFGASIFGAAQEEYKSIDEIRKAARERIRTMDESDYNSQRDAITDRLSAVKIPGAGNGLSDTMDMVQNIQDAVARSHTAKGIHKYLREFYPEVTMEAANEIADIVKDIQRLSARYFEAKPYRAVEFDEVRLAVVPSDTDANLVEQLRRRGIEVRTYEKGDAAQRRQIVKEATEEMSLRFRDMQAADKRPNEKRQRYQDGKTSGNTTALQSKIVSSVEKLSGKLHTPVRIARTPDELPDGAAKRAIEGGRRVKAWFDTGTGEVFLYLPNADSADDATASVLHEVVGHKGLRGLFGTKTEKEFDDVMTELYGQLPVEARERIDKAAEERYGGNKSVAMDEYLAEQAEKDETPSWWDKVVAAVRGFLRKMGVDAELSANDVKYLLWKSKNRLMSTDNGIALIGKIAADESMKERFYIGEYSRTPEQEKADYDRAARVVSDFAHNHAGAADVLVIRSRDMMRKQLAAVGVSEEDSAKYEQWYDEGYTTAFWAPLYKTIFLLDTNVSEHDLNCYLWHENAHKVLDGLEDYDDVVSTIFNYVENELPELYDYVAGMYKVDGGDILREECVSHLLEYMAHCKRDRMKSIYVKHDNELVGNAIRKLIDIINYGKENQKNQDRLRDDFRGWENNGSGSSITERQVSGNSENRNREIEEAGTSGEGEETQLVRFRDTTDDEMPDGSIEEYEAELRKQAFKAKEAYQDSMLALKKLQDIIVKKSGKELKSFEDAYTAENHLSSKNTAEVESYGEHFFRPIIDAIGELMNNGITYEDIKRYVFAKHGLERNEVFAQRDAHNATIERFWKEKEQLERQYSKGKLMEDEYEEMKQSLQQKEHDFYEQQYQENRLRDYSGLTTLTGEKDEYEKISQEIVEEFEKSNDTSDLWKAINNATKETLKKTYECGLINKGTYEKVKSQFKYYIPLRGWNEKTAEDVYEYLQSETSPVNATLKTAKGRMSLADDPFATIGNMAESNIFMSNRNLMKQRFMNMVLNHPSDAVSLSEAWYVKDTSTGDWVLSSPDIQEKDAPEEIRRKIEEHEDRMQELAKDGDATKVKEGLNINYRISDRQAHEHMIVVKRNGKEYVMYVNGNPRAAQAINGLTNPNVNEHPVWKWIGNVNRQLAANFTTRNPAFVATNLSRDLIYSVFSTYIKEGTAYGNKFIGNIPKAMRVVARNLRGKGGNSSEDIYFKEYLANGGETGYANLKDVEAYKKFVKKEIGKITGKKDYFKYLKACASFFSLMNRWAENVSRFNAYMTSREMGKNIFDSVSDAKEVTVNFNKKGAGYKTKGVFGLTSGTFKELFLFFNAAVQSLNNFSKIAVDHKSGFIKMVGGFTTAGFIIPALNTLATSIFGGDDDDYYNNLPEWVRRNNICVYVGSGKFITIPLPIELRAFYGLGEMAYQETIGRGHGGKRIVYDAINQIMELLPINPLGNNGDMVSSFTPDIAKPFAQLIRNKDYTGKPIYKENPFNQYMPEWTKTYSGTSKWLKSLSEWTNDITGGNKYKRGWMNVNPAMVEHLFESYFGGMAKTINQASNTLIAGVESVIDSEKSEDLIWRNAPVLNRFVSDGSDDRTAFSKVNNRYYELYDIYIDVKHQLNGYNKEISSGNFSYLEELSELQNSKEYDIYKVFEQYRKSMDELKKLEKSFHSNNKDGRREIEKDIVNIKKRIIENIDGK